MFSQFHELCTVVQVYRILGFCFESVGGCVEMFVAGQVLFSDCLNLTCIISPRFSSHESLALRVFDEKALLVDLDDGAYIT